MATNGGRPIVLSWSSGKDSAWSLHVLQQDESVQVVGLLTTVYEESERVSVHSVRRELLQAQAAATGLNLWVVSLPRRPSNQQYEEAMKRALTNAKDTGIEAVAFGDLFLEDIRRYREEKMASSGLDLLFPLWGHPTDELAEEMIDGGLRARTTCIDSQRLDASFAGREWDRSFLSDLPGGIDPCGENGEFHTFAYDGPMFSKPIPVVAGEVTQRDGFGYADLLPATK